MNTKNELAKLIYYSNFFEKKDEIKSMVRLVVERLYSKRERYYGLNMYDVITRYINKLRKFD